MNSVSHFQLHGSQRYRLYGTAFSVSPHLQDRHHHCFSAFTTLSIVPPSDRFSVCTHSQLAQHLGNISSNGLVHLFHFDSTSSNSEESHSQHSSALQHLPQEAWLQRYFTSTHPHCQQGSPLHLLQNQGQIRTGRCIPSRHRRIRCLVCQIPDRRPHVREDEFERAQKETESPSSFQW